MMIKGSILQEDITILNVCTPNSIELHRQQLSELQGEMDMPPIQLETSALLYQKWMDLAGRGSEMT